MYSRWSACESVVQLTVEMKLKKPMAVQRYVTSYVCYMSRGSPRQPRHFPLQLQRHFRRHFTLHLCDKDDGIENVNSIFMYARPLPTHNPRSCPAWPRETRFADVATCNPRSVRWCWSSALLAIHWQPSFPPVFLSCAAIAYRAC